MTRMVQCIKLGIQAEALDNPTYPGELGQKIFAHVSKQAWQQWMGHQTILMNENRLSPINPEHRAFLEQEMEKFFFGEGSEMPEGFVPPEKTDK
ncbi:oxidative damage protection protein [Beggiatoa alba]|nr:oxidative damage protection protein [Beggiatoa alba]